MGSSKKVGIASIVLITLSITATLIFYNPQILESLKSTPTPSSTPSPTQHNSSTTQTPNSTPSQFPQDTVPKLEGNVKVGDEVFKLDPTAVETVRPDLFNPGYFSMFDVLVHLEKMGMIDLEYHFDDSMNAHVIDSINGEPHWWYVTYYDGGWPERNAFRPDHYPWKDGTTLRFEKTDPSLLENIYSVWREEVTRRKNNSEKLIIPKVVIRSHSFRKEFENVEVTPHNMRSDVFKENVTSAIDVIMSLGDQGKITYELKWYESIGRAGIVKDYWVEAIDEDKAYNRCGFVYEAGSLSFRFSPSTYLNNHIHLPTDIRLLNSPEYVEFFWICI